MGLLWLVGQLIKPHTIKDCERNNHLYSKWKPDEKRITISKNKAYQNYKTNFKEARGLLDCNASIS